MSITSCACCLGHALRLHAEPCKEHDLTFCIRDDQASLFHNDLPSTVVPDLLPVVSFGEAQVHVSIAPSQHSCSMAQLCSSS